METKKITETLAGSELRGARRELYDVVALSDDIISGEGHNPEELSPAKYWLTVAEQSRRFARVNYSDAEQLSHGSALELTGATPFALIAQQRINHLDRQPASENKASEIRQLVYYQSYYNSLLRTYAEFRPSLKAPELNKHLTDTMRVTLSDPEQLHQPNISTFIVGAQHEIAFGPVLQRLGEARPATTTEDLQNIDYVLCDPRNPRQGMPIDVKASFSSMQRGSVGQYGEWGVSKRQTLVVPSGITHEELDGNFHIPPELAAKKSFNLELVIADAYKKGVIRSVEY